MNHINMSRLFVLVALLFSQQLHSATIRGTVIDKTNEPLIGATVVLNTDPFKYAIVGLDGSYAIKDVPTGTYKLKIDYVGYVSQTKVLEIKSQNDLISLNIVLESDQNILDAVIITADAQKGSIADARLSEKQSNTVINMVSAKSIELSTDLSVANVVQRVSGVTLQRSANGTPQYAVIRGMDKRYNYTLVNGIKLPSPDPENKYVPLDIFPSDIVESVGVLKSLDATMEGDAIGGGIDMRLKSAPDQFMINTSLQLGYNRLFGSRSFDYYNDSGIAEDSPWEANGATYDANIDDFSRTHGLIKSRDLNPDYLLGFSIGGRVLDERLGIIFANSFQHTHQGSDEVRPEVTVSNDGTNRPFILKRQNRLYSDLQRRIASHLQFDYDLNDFHKFKLYGAHFNLRNDEVRDMVIEDFFNSNSSNLALNATLQYETRSERKNQLINIGSLQGESSLSERTKLEYKLTYSKANGSKPDIIRFIRNGQLVDGVEQPQSIELNNTRQWEKTEDTDLSAIVNFSYEPIFLPKGSVIKIGGLSREKERDNLFMRYSINPGGSGSQVQFEHWSDYQDANLSLISTRGSISDERNNLTIENVRSAYGQVEIGGSRVKVNTGIRVEDTESGYILKLDQEGTKDSIYNYTDWLPSFSIKYLVNDKTNLRFSYYRAISRPGYLEIVPYNEGNELGLPEVGNPELDRVRANNLDLRYEFFPNSTNQVLIGLFYKDILDPIERIIGSPPGRDIGDAIFSKNIDQATNYGVEFDLTKYWNKLGLKANYTFTQSEVTTDKGIQERRDINDPTSGIIVKPVQQTRPLQGQSKHIANLSLLFKDQRRAVDIQLAGVFNSKKIAFVSQWLDNDIWDDDFFNLDFSLDKSFMNQRLVGSFKATNITNSKITRIVRLPGSNETMDPIQDPFDDEIIVGETVNRPSFRIGIKYKF